jgi:alcohol dehydrogenase class IV
MLAAANLAIVPTGLGATGIAHSLSHPCGARHGVPHGVANAIHLPVTIEFNAGGEADVVDRYRTVCELLGLDAGGGGEEVGSALAGWVRDLRSRLGLPGRLSEVGVPEDGIPQLAADAMGEGSTLVNPREPSEEDFAELYRRVL